MTLWEFLLSQGQLPSQAQDPRNQAPGMGSIANTNPYGPPSGRQQALTEAEDAQLRAMMSYAGTLGTMAASPGAGPVAVPVAGGLAAYGAYNQYQQGSAEQRAKRMQYQGN